MVRAEPSNARMMPVVQEHVGLAATVLALCRVHGTETEWPPPNATPCPPSQRLQAALNQWGLQWCPVYLGNGTVWGQCDAVATDGRTVTLAKWWHQGGHGGGGGGGGAPLERFVTAVWLASQAAPRSVTVVGVVLQNEPHGIRRVPLDQCVPAWRHQRR